MSESTSKKQTTAQPDQPEDWLHGLTQRLRMCSKIAGSGEALAKRTSIPRRTLETYLSGRAEPKASRLIAIAKAVNVSIDWLATGNPLLENPQTDEEAYYAHFPVHTFLPVMQDLTGAGPNLPKEAPRPPLSFDLAWLKHEFSASPADICAVVLGSEAMNPTLRPSNIVLVDLRKSGHAFEEGLHLLRYGNGMAVRRLQRRPDNTIVISCDNPVYETLRLTGQEFKEKVEVIGRVIWFGRKP